MKAMDRLSRILGSRTSSSELGRRVLDTVDIRLIAEGRVEGLADFAKSSRLHMSDPKGDTPLHLAARMGNLAVCDLFIRSGADPRSVNHDRQTPADVAFAEGHYLAGQLLSSLVANSLARETVDNRVAPRGLESVVKEAGAEKGPPSTAEPEIERAGGTDDLDFFLSFEAVPDPEEFHSQSVVDLAQGTFVPTFTRSSATAENLEIDWDLDLSPTQIVGDGIGSKVLLSPVKGDEHDFLKVLNRGRKSARKAAVQTGTQLSIEPNFCLAWAQEVLAKRWYSGDDLGRLIDSCEGNGDPDELRMNLVRNLELVGLTSDEENPEEADLWDAKSDVSADDLADIIEVTLTRATRLPGTQRFVMDKSDEQQLLEPMMRAKQELLLGILASEAAVEAILEAVDKIADASRDPGSFSLRTIIPSRPGHSETSEMMAASEALKSWHISGRVMDGKRRREALAALDALDLSLAYQRALVVSLKAREVDFDQAVQLDRLISAYETANERLILEHLPYARRFAARNVEPDEDPEDVFQVAFTGLQRSTRRFDPDRGVRFVIYCAFWMKQALTRWRADEGSSIRVPVHRHEDLAKLDAAIDRLDVRGRGMVSDDDLAIELEWTADQVRQFRRIPRAAEYPDGSDEWDALLPGPAELDVLGRAATARIVTEVLAELPDRQADVIRMRFGIGRETEMTLEEIGQIYGVTRERIRQIEAKALKFMSHPARRRRLRTLLGYEVGRTSNPSALIADEEKIAHEAVNLVEVVREDQAPAQKSDDQLDQLMQLWSAGMSANEITQKLGDLSWKSVVGEREADGC